VYIGGTGGAHGVTKSTRNVGILCKAAMRDVGMMHMCENEKPMTRNIAVGAGEMGVGGGDFYGDSVSAGIGGGKADSSDGNSQVVNQAVNQINMATFQSRHIHIKSDQIRSVIDELLRKTVHSVETQCRFTTDDKVCSM